MQFQELKKDQQVTELTDLAGKMKDEVKAKLTSEQVAALEQVTNTTSTMDRMCVPPS